MISLCQISKGTQYVGVYLSLHALALEGKKGIGIFRGEIRLITLTINPKGRRELVEGT